MFTAIYDGKLDSLRDLLKRGANPNVLTGQVLNSPLIEVFTISLDDTVRRKMIEILIEFGANPYIENANGATALEIASTDGLVGCVNALLSKTKKADLLSRALDEACKGGHIKVVTSLIQNGADINSKNEYGNTPLHSTCNRFRENEGVVKIVSELLSRGADIYAKNNQGDSALDLADFSNLPNTAALLREKEAEMNRNPT